MAKYFKLIEIEEDEFKNATGDELDCAQLSIPVGGEVFVAVDDENEYEICILLDFFEEGVLNNA